MKELYGTSVELELLRPVQENHTEAGRREGRDEGLDDSFFFAFTGLVDLTCINEFTKCVLPSTWDAPSDCPSWF